MTRLTRTTVSLVSLSLLLLGSAVQATTIDWVTVGNPGNAADQNYAGQGQFGSVDHAFRISKTEVTNTQYAEFLNAVDSGGTNPNGVYSPLMDPDTGEASGGIKFVSGNSSGSKYVVKPGHGSQPVLFVSFFDSMRFTNWLQNGQPTDGSGTETGSYTIGTGVSETRAAGAKFFIPSENEWYKAAYYDPRTDAQGGPPGNDNYWLYPMQTDSPPTSSPPPGTSPAANFYDGTTGFALTGSFSFDVTQNYLTDAGAYNTSPSFYGTFDQGGNVWEWTEEVLFGTSRELRGASWAYNANYLAASFRNSDSPAGEFIDAGFRVASLLPEIAAVPEPSSFVLAALGLLGLSWIALRRKNRRA